MPRDEPHRKERLESRLIRVLSQLLQEEIKDPRLQEVTLIKVELSGDYSVADIDFAIRGEKDAEKQALKALEKANGYLRGRLSDFLDLRKMPELRWKIDRNIAHSIRMKQLMEGEEPTVPPSEEDQSEDPYGLLEED